jgi:hypothetical protein
LKPNIRKFPYDDIPMEWDKPEKEEEMLEEKNIYWRFVREEFVKLLDISILNVKK